MLQRSSTMTWRTEKDSSKPMSKSVTNSQWVPIGVASAATTKRMTINLADNSTMITINKPYQLGNRLPLTRIKISLWNNRTRARSNLQQIEVHDDGSTWSMLPEIATSDLMVIEKSPTVSTRRALKFDTKSDIAQKKWLMWSGQCVSLNLPNDVNWEKEVSIAH